MHHRFLVLGLVWAVSPLAAQDPVIPPPQFVPRAAAVTDEPYQPRALKPGGIVMTLYPSDSPMLHRERLHEAEIYQMDPSRPGVVRTMTNIHNPSIEIHPAGQNGNAGAAVILIAGGGHRRLFIASGSIDPANWLINYQVATVILRYRLRADGYNAEIDAVNDALQAIRMVRFHADEWGIDPSRIGLMGFSAGGEVASGSALGYPAFDAAPQSADDPYAGVSSRPDFIGLIYTGPSALTRDPATPIPADIPPAFIASASYGEARHTIWSLEYYRPMLAAEVPNIELHLYGNGGHGGGIADRGGIPMGTWPDRFIDWFRDLGFLTRPGLPTKAAEDIKSHLASP